MWRMPCAALALMIVSSCPILGHPHTQDLKLAVSVRSSKSTYSIKDKIQLEIQLTNIGTEPLLIRRPLDWGVGRTDIRVFDPDGKEVFTTVLADSVPPPPKETDFFELEPNEFFGVSLKEPLKHFINTPGEYEFVVDYTSPDDEQWVRKNLTLPQVPLWDRAHGTIQSNHIKITVRP